MGHDDGEQDKEDVEDDEDEEIIITTQTVHSMEDDEIDEKMRAKITRICNDHKVHKKMVAVVGSEKAEQ